MKKLLMILVMLIAADAVYSGKTGADTVRAWNKLSLGTNDNYYMNYQGIIVGDSGRFRRVYFSGLPSGYTGDSCIILKNGIPSILSASSFRVMIGAATPQQVRDTALKYDALKIDKAAFSDSLNVHIGTDNKIQMASGATLIDAPATVSSNDVMFTDDVYYDSSDCRFSRSVYSDIGGATVSLLVVSQGVYDNSLTANRVVVTDGTKKLVSSSVTPTVLAYLDVASSVQGLLNSKLNLTSFDDSLNDNIGSDNYLQKASGSKLVNSIVSEGESVAAVNGDVVAKKYYSTYDNVESVSGVYSPSKMVYRFDEGRGWGYNSADNVIYAAMNATVPFTITENKVSIGGTVPDSTSTVFGSSHVTGNALIGGRLGIATSPTQPLEVYRSGGLPATSGTISNAHIRIYGAGGTALDLGANNSSPWQSWIQATDPSNLNVEYSFLINPNGGNVGVGDLTPDAKLDVAGSLVVDSTASVDTLVVDWTVSDTGRASKIGVGKKLLPMPFYQDPTSKAMVLNPVISPSSDPNHTQVLLDPSPLDSGIGGGCFSQATDGFGLRTFGGWQAVKNTTILGDYEGRFDAFSRKNGGALINFIRAIGESVLYVGNTLMNAIVIEQKNGGDIYIGNGDYYASTKHIFIRNFVSLFPSLSGGYIDDQSTHMRFNSGSASFHIGNNWSNNSGSIRVVHNAGTNNVVEIFDDDTLKAATISKTFGQSVTGICTLKTQVGVPVSASSFKIKIIGDMITMQLQQLVVPYPGTAYQVLLFFPDGVLPQCVYTGLEFSINMYVGGQRVTGSLVRFSDDSRAFSVYTNSGPWIPNTGDGILTQSVQYFSN